MCARVTPVVYLLWYTAVTYQLNAMCMKITQSLPQFEDTKALLLVSGTQFAEAYEASRGEIQKIVAFRAELPESDERAHIKVRGGKGQTMGVWSTKQDAKEVLQREFVADFKKQTKTLADAGWDEVYLFAPAHAMKTLVESLPPKLRDVLAGEIAGNYTKAEPFALLKKIKIEA